MAPIAAVPAIPLRVQKEVPGIFGNRDRAGLPMPTVEHGIHGDQGVFGVTEGDKIASPFRDLAPTEVAFERLKAAALGGIEIQFLAMRHFEPGDDARDVVEIHIAPGA